MRSLLFFAVAIVVIVEFNVAAPTSPAPNGEGKGEGKGPKLNSKAAKDKLMATCQEKKNKCKGQLDEYKAKRKATKDNLLDGLKTQNLKISDQDADKEVEKQLNKIQELKKKVHEKNNIAEIDPADDGLWQGDIVLTFEQADNMLKNLDNPIPISKTPGGNKHKRSAAIYFEDPLNNRWNNRWKMPIHYWIPSTFTASEKSTIDAALSTITLATGCIQFVKDAAAFTSGAQMQYVKPLGGGCYGFSYIGYRGGIHQITVAPMSSGWCAGGSNVLKGLVMHETIHALGGGHEQTRLDRDWYIQILFGHIDPQLAYNYEMDLLSTSYGVPYNYQSIMHYQQGLFASTEGLKTMYPDTTLGSDFLSSSDALQLKRMYCRPTSCLDNSQGCGTWAIDGYCTDIQYGSWMKSNCAKSCGFC